MEWCTRLCWHKIGRTSVAGVQRVCSQHWSLALVGSPLVNPKRTGLPDACLLDRLCLAQLPSVTSQLTSCLPCCDCWNCVPAYDSVRIRKCTLCSLRQHCASTAGRKSLREQASSARGVRASSFPKREEATPRSTDLAHVVASPSLFLGTTCVARAQQRGAVTRLGRRFPEHRLLA